MLEKRKYLPTFEEFIEGGKGSGHKSEEFDKFELELGTRVELEHVSGDKEISQTDMSDANKNAKAQEISIDHLTENGTYYTDGFKAGLFDEDITDILDKWKDDPRAQELKKILNETETEVEKFPHEIKSEAYWKKILFDNPYALKILDTVITKQNAKASDKQMNVFRRVERGEKVTSKN